MFVLLIILLCGFYCTNKPCSPDLTKGWPDSVYQLISTNSIIKVSPDSLEQGKEYLAVHSFYLPTYISVAVSGSKDETDRRVDLQGYTPLSDTTVLRIRCSPEDVDATSISKLLNELQGRINSLWIGKRIQLHFDTGMGQANYLRKLQDASLIRITSDLLIRSNSDTINVIISDIFANTYRAHRATKTIGLTKNGLYQPQILLHELGHIFYASHPDDCCNLCNCAEKHFMFAVLDTEAVKSQIKVSDLLSIIRECDDNSICNYCDINIDDGCDKRSEAKSILSLIDKIHIDSLNFNYKYKIGMAHDFKKELGEVYQKIKSQESILENKYRQEYKWYATDDGSSKESIDRFIELQVQSRRNFRLERFELILNEFKKLSNVDTTYVNHLLEITIESLQTGVYKESNW